ncbi:MAG: S-layer homology domain-containing protein [Myxococcota bacterium]|nr:S-layer homology domain-containing protein [Myxococcota bacterium]
MRRWQYMVAALALAGCAAETDAGLDFVTGDADALERAEATPTEADFFSRMNRERTSRGLRALKPYWDLVDDARAHAIRMRDRGRLYHSPDMASYVRSDVWRRLGENVGRGGSVGRIHDLFMGSDGHRANILGDYDYAGIGVHEEPSGQIWVTVLFMKATRGGLEDHYPPFADDDGDTHERDIYAIYAAGITRGCGPRRYCPDAPVTRAQMASFLVRALDLPPSSDDRFTDDDRSSHEADIQALAASGITRGCGGTRYCPDAPVTRAQMATFLDRALSLPSGRRDHFADDDGHWAERHIDALAESGITRGCGAGRFCPEEPVTRAQMASFLARALGL